MQKTEIERRKMKRRKRIKKEGKEGDLKYIMNIKKGRQDSRSRVHSQNNLEFYWLLWKFLKKYSIRFFVFGLLWSNRSRFRLHVSLFHICVDWY